MKSAEVGPGRARTAPEWLWLRLVRIVPRSLALALLFVLSVAAQSPGIPPRSPLGVDHGQANSRFPTQQQPEEPNLNPMIEARRIKTLNQLRHKTMVDDADKLLLLARQLNDDSEKMSPTERVHKAAEIEKLARSVRDKMSFTVDNDPVRDKYTTVLH